MSHLTYLIGAGASKNALPLDNELVKVMEELNLIGRKHPKEIIDQSYFDSFENRFKKVVELASKESSIDTLAKKHQYNSYMFYDIKNLIWSYFSIEAGKNNIDKRYTNLLLRVQDDNASRFKLKENVSFLTWNYDLQIAEAIASIDHIDIGKVAEKYYTHPGYELLYPDLINRNSKPKLFKLIHLNGCAGYYRKLPDNNYTHWCGCDIADPHRYNDFIRLVEQNFYTNTINSSSNRNSISFAFENNHFKEQSLKYSKQIAAETTHLVIIGYSLPDFNKSIDSQILDEMKKLRYVCIQNPLAEKIKTKLLGISKNIQYRHQVNELEFYLEDDDMNQFHLPPDIF